MKEGQFESENKHTEMFFQAKKDHESNKYSKQYTCNISSKDDDSFIEYISPLRTVKLDTTRTELTGVAKLTVTVNHQEQA